MDLGKGRKNLYRGKENTANTGANKVFMKNPLKVAELIKLSHNLDSFHDLWSFCNFIVDGILKSQ